MQRGRPGQRPGLGLEHLENWVVRLDEAGLPHSRILRALRSWLVVAADPDGNRIRLYSLEDHDGTEPPDEDAWLDPQATVPLPEALRAAGFTVRVWNRTRSKAAPLADVGATVHDTPAAAAKDADVLLTVLSDGPTVQAQVREALPALASDAVWVQLATVGLAPLDDLRDVADRAGVPLIDASVSGNPDDAEAGRARGARLRIHAVPRRRHPGTRGPGTASPAAR